MPLRHEPDRRRDESSERSTTAHQWDLHLTDRPNSKPTFGSPATQLCSWSKRAEHQLSEWRLMALNRRQDSHVRFAGASPL